MGKKYLLLILLIVICVLIALWGQVFATFINPERIPEENKYIGKVNLNEDEYAFMFDERMKTEFFNIEKLGLPEEKNENYPEIKGLYITGWVAGMNHRMNEFIELANQTVINAFVIDVKDDTGYISYRSSVPLAKEIKASQKKIKDIKSLISKLKAEGIYVIGRVVVFKDPVLAKAKEERALELRKGDLVWKDDEWVNPYNKENWDYVIKIAEEAVQFGFDEIQFDYVRFPALGNGPTQVGYKDEKSKEEIITEFLQYAQEKLDRYNVLISADIFGAVTSVDHDLGIGQRLESISKVVDIISPMIYPSHYAEGVFNLNQPEAAPYETVYNSMNDAINRLSQENYVRLRPWLQDFSLRIPYGSKEVRDQIKALEDLGIEEWLLWNPKSIYTKEALLKDDVGVEVGFMGGNSIEGSAKSDLNNQMEKNDVTRVN